MHSSFPDKVIIAIITCLTQKIHVEASYLLKYKSFYFPSICYVYIRMHRDHN